MTVSEDVAKIARRIDVATGKAPADLVIRNANVVNVFLRKVELCDVAVADGCIAGVYPAAKNAGSEAAEDIVKIDAEKEVDAEGKYLIPGLIDAHTHVEMAYVSPSAFAEGVLPWGTTTVVMDPHDTVNVMGNEGMAILAEDFKSTPLKVLLNTPPCVPSAPVFEDSGFEVTLESLKESRNIPLASGIAETMDFGRVLSKEPEMMKMLAYGRSEDMLFDGHAPCVRGKDAMAYYGTGPIRTEHESVSVDEAYEKYGLGVHVILRRGSLEDPVHAGELVKKLPDTSRILLATDGCINVSDIVEKGHMNYVLKQIVSEGVDPLQAVQMATINTARAYRIDNRVGAVAPGYEADMVLVEDLKDFSTVKVWINGEEIRRPYTLPRYEYPQKALTSVKLDKVTEDDIALCCKDKSDNDDVKVRVMTAKDLSLETTLDIMTAKAKNGQVQTDTGRDILKGAVFERYGRGKGYNVGLIRGFGLKEGAIAGSIGQDSQNLVAVGVSDADICAAVNSVADMQGGVVLVCGGKKVASIELPIFGIMTDRSFEELNKDFEEFNAVYKKLGGTLTDPVFTLSLLLTLVVIPDGGLSNRGLVDVLGGKFVDVVLD